MEKRGNIAIDGPAGAGKSTVARLLADRLNYLYIDTGAMYRALTYKVIQLGIDPDDEETIEHLAGETEITLAQASDEGQLQVICDGDNVTDAIRDPQVSMQVSRVSRIAGVRSRMVELQQRMASDGGVVMDGRDIGTRVLPDAPYKYFLTATLEERSRRRYTELTAKGHTTSYEDTFDEISARDNMDAHRAESPLVQAQDAVLIDTDSLTPGQVVEKILAATRR
ncbi:MAG: (d)CMP kinase [Bacillota bacterium]